MKDERSSAEKLDEVIAALNHEQDICLVLSWSLSMSQGAGPILYVHTGPKPTKANRAAMPMLPMRRADGSAGTRSDLLRLAAEMLDKPEDFRLAARTLDERRAGPSVGCTVNETPS